MARGVQQLCCDVSWAWADVAPGGWSGRPVQHSGKRGPRESGSTIRLPWVWPCMLPAGARGCQLSLWMAAGSSTSEKGPVSLLHQPPPTEPKKNKKQKNKKQEKQRMLEGSSGLQGLQLRRTQKPSGRPAPLHAGGCVSGEPIRRRKGIEGRSGSLCPAGGLLGLR